MGAYEEMLCPPEVCTEFVKGSRGGDMPMLAVYAT